MFGIDCKRVNAIFGDRAHRADTGGRGRIDVFWPVQIAVEHKSKGKDLAVATEQPLTYLALVTVFLPKLQLGVCPHCDGACDRPEDVARLSTIDQFDFYSCSRIQC